MPADGHGDVLNRKWSLRVSCRYGGTAGDRAQYSGYSSDAFYTATAVMEHGDGAFNHTPASVITSLDPRDSLYRLSAMDNGTDPTVQQVLSDDLACPFWTISNTVHYALILNNIILSVPDRWGLTENRRFYIPIYRCLNICFVKIWDGCGIQIMIVKLISCWNIML